MYHESISLSILEKAGPYTQSVITGARPERGDLVVVKPSLPTEEHVWGMLTEPVSPGSEEWYYNQLTAEEVGNHLSQYMINSEPTVTAEGIKALMEGAGV